MKKKPMLVLGSGETGVSSVKFLLKQKRDVILSTQSKLFEEFRDFLLEHRVPFEEGGHTAGFVRQAGMAVVSPGIKPTSDVIKLLKRCRVRPASDIEVFWNDVKAPLLAVTGTNGKTSTCTLLHRMVSGKRPADLCGNIGKSLPHSLLEVPANRPRVLELSSFQLKYTQTFRPSVAVILNMSPNHVDWHGTLSDYYASKARIARNMTKRDALVLNANDAEVKRATRVSKARRVWWSEKPLADGFWLNDDSVMLAVRGKSKKVLDLSRSAWQAPHQKRNMLAAAAAAHAAGIGFASIQRAITSIHHLAHRLESAGEVSGIKFINDSKSTTEESTLAALESLSGQVVLIAGGRAKQPSFARIGKYLGSKSIPVVLFGESAMMIQSQFNGAAVVKKTLAEALEWARQAAKPGQTVLFSPMCASFDQFTSYQDRGERFKALVKCLN